MMRRMVECVNLMVMLILAMLVLVIDNDRPMLTILTAMLLCCIVIDLSFWLRGRE